MWYLMVQITFQRNILCRMPVPFLVFQMCMEPFLALKVKSVYSATIKGQHIGDSLVQLLTVTQVAGGDVTKKWLYFSEKETLIWMI